MLWWVLDVLIGHSKPLSPLSDGTATLHQIKVDSLMHNNTARSFGGCGEAAFPLRLLPSRHGNSVGTEQRRRVVPEKIYKIYTAIVPAF